MRIFDLVKRNDQRKIWKVIDILSDSKVVSSKSEARRKIEEGGVKANDEIVKEWDKEIKAKDGTVIQLGKKNYIQIKSNF